MNEPVGFENQRAPNVAVQPLTFLARLAQSAAPPPTMPSLGFQVAAATSQLGSFLTVRGDESVEHYVGAALTMNLFEPMQNDVRALEGALLMFVRYDRRAPTLPALVSAGQLRIQRQNSIHFIQVLRDQRAFQPIYTAARQIETYGARWGASKKAERVVLLSRELCGRPLVAALNAVEQRFLTLASPE